MKLQFLEIMPKHCSEAVCTLLLRVAGTITDVACNASTSEQGMVTSPASHAVLVTNISNADKSLFFRNSGLYMLILWSTN